MSKIKFDLETKIKACKEYEKGTRYRQKIEDRFVRPTYIKARSEEHHNKPCRRPTASSQYAYRALL